MFKFKANSQNGLMDELIVTGSDHIFIHSLFSLYTRINKMWELEFILSY